MTRLAGVALIAATLCTYWGAAAQTGYVPPRGFVPNAGTAIAVAHAILTPIYGPEHLKMEEPFVAVPRGDTWLVYGSLACAPGDACRGGVVEVVIARADARIIRVIHGQ